MNNQFNQSLPRSFEFTKVEEVTTLVEHHTTYTAIEALRYAAVQASWLSGALTNTIFGVFPNKYTARRFVKDQLLDGYVVDLQTGERVS